MNLLRRGGNLSVSVHRRRRRSLPPASASPREIRFKEIPHSVNLSCFSTGFRPPRIRLRSAMEAPGESSAESSGSGGGGYVYVSGGEKSAPEEGISGGGGEFGDSGVNCEEEREEWESFAPQELAKGVVILECESSAAGGLCEVYLVGTAHVSQESCREVEAVINSLKPEVVFLELCANRVSLLTPQDLKVPTMNEMIEMWRKKDSNAFGILYSFFLAKVASRLEVFPGAEFRVAFEVARNFGSKVVLGDRPVHITLRRSWGRMSLWHKAKFLYFIIFQSVFLPSSENLNKLLKELDDQDMLTVLVQEMSKEFPTLMETLLIERDMYMSSRLLRVASEHSSVVAVVGRGHLAGIKKYWKMPLQVDHLLEIPQKSGYSRSTKILASLGAVATGAAIISGIYLACRKGN